MQQDQSASTPAGSPSAQEKTPSLRGYRMDSGNIPQEIRSYVANHVGAEAEVFPAKENGSYKGPVIHADRSYIVQAVGKDHQTAVVHQRADVQIMGAALQNRDARNDLVNRNLQIHYRGDQAKAYPWDSEKEASQRTARVQERPVADPAAERGAVAGEVQSEAEKYAFANIKNVKQREAFLKHLSNVTQNFQQPREPEKTDAKAAEKEHVGQRPQEPAQNDVKHYSIYDGRHDANFTSKGSAEMLADAEKYGWTKFQAHMKDGSIQQVSLDKDAKWVREDGVVVVPGALTPLRYEGWDEQNSRKFFGGNEPDFVINLAEQKGITTITALYADKTTVEVKRDKDGLWKWPNGETLHLERQQQTASLPPKNIPLKGQARTAESPSQDIER